MNRGVFLSFDFPNPKRKNKMTTTPNLTETKQPLILTGSGYGLQIAPAYQELKLELLKKAALITTVADEIGDAAADAQIKALGAMRIETEKSRKLVKEPAIVFGRDVDQKAKDFIVEIDAEESRLKSLRGEFAQEVLAERHRLLTEIRAKAEAEATAKREADEAKRQADAAAEKARLEAEELAFSASTPEEDAQAARAAELMAAAEAKRIGDAADAAARAASLPVNVTTFVPEAPKGVKMVVDVEIISADLLYEYDLGLVDVTARRADLLRHIEARRVGDTLPEIPGVRVFLRPQVR